MCAEDRSPKLLGSLSVVRLKRPGLDHADGPGHKAAGGMEHRGNELNGQVGKHEEKNGELFACQVIGCRS